VLLHSSPHCPLASLWNDNEERGRGPENERLFFFTHKLPIPLERRESQGGVHGRRLRGEDALGTPTEYKRVEIRRIDSRASPFTVNALLLLWCHAITAAGVAQ